MMAYFQKFIFLSLAIFVGFIFYTIHIPAGWLIGALLTGIFYGIFIKQVPFGPYPFKVVLAFIGTTISLLLMVSTLKVIHHLIIPLIITILILITAGFFFGILLHKKTTGVSKITAFFCCIPGGASEIIGMSGEYGADDRLVAAFHTVRMTMFSIAIPIIVAILHPVQQNVQEETMAFSLQIHKLLFFIVDMDLNLLVNHFIKISGGTLLLSIAIGFIFSEFVMTVNDVHPYVVGVGQALIGAFVGIKFDRNVLKSILKVGPTVIAIVMMLFSLTLVTSALFMFMTGQAYATSLISTVPAGAPEMSVTALALDVNPTVVASLHIFRVVLLFLTLPILLKIFYKLNPPRAKG